MHKSHGFPKDLGKRFDQISLVYEMFIRSKKLFRKSES